MKDILINLLYFSCIELFIYLQIYLITSSISDFKKWSVSKCKKR